MTTNQTIDGVPRAALEIMLSGKGGLAQAAAAHELRALLDAPAKCDKCYGAGKFLIYTVCGPTHKTCDCSKPVAQPQGEPVAWHCVGDIGTEHVTLSQDCANAWFSHGGRSLSLVYAEQPAPVAEQLIERLAQRFPDLENMYTAEVFADWLRAELNPSL